MAAIERAIAEVYPRVGGGNADSHPCADGVIGLSPRGRGKLWYTLGLRAFWGSIPAWAGET